MKIGPGVSELWGVENRPLPLTRPMAYTTACTTVQAVMYWTCMYWTSLSLEICLFPIPPIASPFSLPIFIPNFTHFPKASSFCPPLFFVYVVHYCKAPAVSYRRWVLSVCLGHRHSSRVIEPVRMIIWKDRKKGTKVFRVRCASELFRRVTGNWLMSVAFACLSIVK